MMEQAPWRARAKQRMGILCSCFVATVIALSISIFYARNIVHYLWSELPQLESLQYQTQQLKQKLIDTGAKPEEDAGLLELEARLAEVSDISPIDFEPVTFLLTSALAFMVIIGASIYKANQLNGGPGPLLVDLNARLLGDNPSEPEEKMLQALVREVAEAAEIPMPLITILDDEPAINAFSLGNPDQDTVICVTAGALRVLQEDELKAVVSHEMSHIVFGDTIVNFNMLSLVHGLTLIYNYGVRMCSKGSGDNDTNNMNPLVRGSMLFMGLAMLSVGYFGLFFARLLKFIMCRSREYHADSVAVSFMESHEGLVSALKKVGGFKQQSFLRSKEVEAISHCCFAKAIKSHWVFDWFPTAPPLLNRIRRWDPSFDGVFTELRWTKRGLQEQAVVPAPAAPPEVAPPAPALDAAQPPETVMPRSDAAVNEVQNGANRAPAAPNSNKPITVLHHENRVELAYPRDLFNQIPEALRRMAGTASGAQAVLFAVLIKPLPVRDSQLRALASANDPQLHMETLKALRLVESCTAEQRGTLSEFVKAGLQQMPRDEYVYFRETVEGILSGEGGKSEADFCIEQLVIYGLDRQFKFSPENSSNGSAAQTAMDPALAAAGVVAPFAAIVADGANDTMAKLAHANSLMPLPEQIMNGEIDSSRLTVAVLERSLIQMVSANSDLRSKVFHVCAAIAAADGKASVRDAQLLRAVAAGLQVEVGLSL